MKQRMLLGKAQRSSASASSLRPSATAVGLLPTVPSAGSEEGLPGREPRRSEGAPQSWEVAAWQLQQPAARPPAQPQVQGCNLLKAKSCSVND